MYTFEHSPPVDVRSTRALVVLAVKLAARPHSDLAIWKQSRALSGRGSEDENLEVSGSGGASASSRYPYSGVGDVQKACGTHMRTTGEKKATLAGAPGGHHSIS